MTRILMTVAFAGVLGGAGPATASPAGKARPAAPPQAVPAAEYLFAERGVYELIAAPGQITDIVLEPGETLVEANPIAAGDTARWVIGDTTSGEGGARRVHVVVKPVQADLSTNLIINTTRRSYHLQLRSSSRTFLAQVAWRYPAPLAGLASAPAAVPEPVIMVPAPKPIALNLGYRVKGAAPWRPLRVFDDGTRTYVEFAPTVVLTDLPPLFLVGPDGKTSELVNYRVEGRRLIVDRLFDRAELRFGGKRWERRVRIERRPAGSEARR